MATIALGNDVLTVVVVFTVPPDQQAGFVRQLEQVAAEHSRHEGFVCCAIHRSVDGLRVVEYIQWRTRAHFEVMLAAQAADGHVNKPPFPADVHVYEVAAVVLP
ncbi:MAG: antibiotic biosynthesis monooxygenase [Nakamurella sp.]